MAERIENQAINQKVDDVVSFTVLASGGMSLSSRATYSK